MSQRWLRILFRRRIMVTFLLALQIGILVFVVSTSSQKIDLINRISTITSYFVVIYIISKNDKSSYKLTWVILILVFPVFGGLFYLLFNFQSSTTKVRKTIEKIKFESQSLFVPKENILTKIANENEEVFPLVKYLQGCAGFPVYQNTQTEYLTPGELMFERLTEELKKAERYIFLEYFIIQEGIMWNTVLEILKEKAKQGVDVRVIYDDMGCFFLLPKDYQKTLESMGIHCFVFNAFQPIMSTIQNNRDHRKIAVIDGKTAFTGGINLADEYINAIDKHGYWKDASIMVHGDAAWSFTLMFLQMWSLCKNTIENYNKYRPRQTETCPVLSDGYVQPYADSPIDNENVGEHVYLKIINNAKKYVYINTPYLIIDDAMVSALKLAAKSGVDVRIVTPHRWDKRFVHMTTRSYYRELLRAGVKIYEYSRGFMHSKTFVSDDKVATVGTTNLDFRSLYLHFECGVLLYKNRSVMEIKKDYLDTLNICQEITMKDCVYNAFIRFVQEILRVFAPLM